MPYWTKQAAIESLIEDGFQETDSGFFSKKSMTGGSLTDPPYPCIALCKIVHNRVDQKLASEGFDCRDFYTIRFL